MVLGPTSKKTVRLRSQQKTGSEEISWLLYEYAGLWSKRPWRIGI